MTRIATFLKPVPVASTALAAAVTGAWLAWTPIAGAETQTPPAPSVVDLVAKTSPAVVTVPSAKPRTPVKATARSHRKLTGKITAQVGTAPSDIGVAAPGMVLTIRYDGDEDDVETVLLGSREEGAHGDLQVISPHSPLGAALLGARIGETREYRLPDGGSMKVTLVSAEPFTG